MRVKGGPHSVPSDNVTVISFGSDGKPVPVIVRTVPPPTSMSSFGLTSVASNGVSVVTDPGLYTSPKAATFT